MLSELFDIVDENNVHTGERVARSEVHSNGLWHRTVHIYYFRKESDRIFFLVHLRAKHKDLHPNTWDTRFGGHIKAGETVETTAVGEVKEEIGLTIRFSDLLVGPVRKRDHYPNREFSHVFFFEGEEDIGQLRFEDDEVQEVKWMAEDEIAESMAAEPDRWSGTPDGFRFVSGFLKGRIN